jgi:hypothetical protein
MRSGDAPSWMPVNDSSTLDAMHQGMVARICCPVARDDSTLGELAGVIGMSVETFVAALDGGQTLSLPQLAKLGTALGVDPDWLVSGTSFVSGTGPPAQHVSLARNVSVTPSVSDRAFVGSAVETGMASVSRQEYGRVQGESPTLMPAVPASCSGTIGRRSVNLAPATRSRLVKTRCTPPNRPRLFRGMSTVPVANGDRMRRSMTPTPLGRGWRPGALTG